MKNLIFYEFSRAKIEAGDFRNFLSLYSPERLGTGHRLREMMGCLELVVAGYDHDPRELYEIPEVRRFFAALHRAWPHSLYFSFLGVPGVPGAGLSSLAFSCVPINIIRDDRRRMAGVSFGPELVEWVADGFVSMNNLSVMAGYSHAENYDRTHKVLGYFDLLP